MNFKLLKNMFSKRESSIPTDVKPFTVEEAYALYDREVRRNAAVVGTIPHCDSNVLHHPDRCSYCADPKRQDLHDARKRLKIAYTGESPFRGEFMCPAQAQRPLERIHAWYGNSPHA